MKYVNIILIIAAVILAFVSLYYWLALGRIDYAAFFLAMSTGLHAVYLHSTKSDKG